MWAALAAATLALALAGCAGSNATPASADKPAASAPASESSANDEVGEIPSSVDADSIQACLDLAGPFAEVGSKMATLVGESNDPQTVVDLYTALADGLGSIADSTSSPEMKAAAKVAQTDMLAVRDGVEQVYVHGEISGVAELTSATAAMQKSYQALLSFCSQ